MKIGTFAKQFGLNSSAVRFYIQSGLLVPDRKGGQYEFGKDCVTDMENILKYKSFHFTLEEIQLLFFLEKASRLQDRVVLEVCADMLKKKRSDLIEERDRLTDCIEDLGREIENLPDAAPVDSFPTGVPFSFIPYLYCPRCQTPLQLDSASLSGGRLHKGELCCDCGYRASIDSGIILCKSASADTPFKAFENVESVIAVTHQFSPSYRMLIEKAYLWMYNRIRETVREPGLIMTGPFTFNFLLKYIENLDQSSTYIIVDPSRKRIEKLQTYLSSWSHNIVYIAGNTADLPIKRGTVDIYIDDFSMTNCMFTYNDFDVPHIAPLLKRRGQAVGIFSGYASAPKSLANFKLDHPSFSPEKMTLRHLKADWASWGVTVTDVKSMGMTTGGEKHFPQQTEGEQIETFAYNARM